MNIIRVTPHPSGGAVTLRLALNNNEIPLLVATETPTPPSNPTMARVVLDENSNPHKVPVEGARITGLTHVQVLDWHKSLGKIPLYYHLYDARAPHAVLQTILVDARNPTSETSVSHMRTLITDRLAFHCDRILNNGELTVATNEIPILQQNALAKDDPLPCILINETIVPTNAGIGHHRGEFKDPITGTLYMEYTHRGRSRVDLLVLSEKPAERNKLARLLHEALLNDFALFSDTGWQGVEPQLSMMSGVTQDGRLQMGESITIDGIVDYVRRVKIS